MRRRAGLEVSLCNILQDLFLNRQIGYRAGAARSSSLAISKSLGLASCVAAVSVLSTRTVQPFLVLSDLCGLPTLT